MTTQLQQLFQTLNTQKTVIDRRSFALIGIWLLTMITFPIAFWTLGSSIIPVGITLAAIVQQHIRSKGVDLRLNAAVTGFNKIGEEIEVVWEDQDEDGMVIQATFELDFTMKTIWIIAPVMIAV